MWQMGSISYFCFCLFGLLTASYFLPSANAGVCPGGWMTFQSHCYGVFHEKLTWKAAEEECRSYGHKGHLASILNWAEADVVATHIVKNHKDIGHVWIGLNDHWGFRVFKWTDNSPLKYKSWMKSKPQFFTLTKYCVQLVYFKGYKEWKDVDCEQRAAYLCKFTSM
ncbi:C-type lectin BPL-like [Rhineura floridana]|uniref:C-type lectin BPL-like n=1 Tax=Rhineura floridana TaxID=261503 RepID=UPI002AC83E5C|nr:C-type lectin BPL-like [Rhineura floridana]